ncbi:hypothetical protein [Paenibacillus jilunlii]|uniref:Swt1-like HEPN domain-containing protein n=1 Tax=Paenibacillus jilunlii TaxID=682956 RepID=A0A1G9WJA6_9BACL|nr:hypothetical protein [Paenibacillus jilunlii]KWX73544.1 hypothetical protein AML91_17880 [Paenibacillus jilunlii]SDM84560.1 hypothetical protein SAMN05216191_11995 [Paenibacillus jilunlii]
MLFKPKQSDEELLENIINKLQTEVNLTVNEKKTNMDPQLHVYDKTVTLSATFDYNHNQFSINMDKRTFTDENVIVDFTLETSIESTSLQDDIYNLKVRSKNVLNSMFKGVYWQKDTQNEKVCSELYSLIHILENRFRELIVQFLVNKYGFDWTKRISEELSQKIDGFSGWYRRKYEDFKSVKTELFNLQIDDLMTLLKSAYDIQPVSKEEFINNVTSVDIDTNTVNLLIEEYKASSQDKDIWNKYFVEILGEQFPGYWEFLKNSRNMVAHNKPVCNQLYNDTKDMIAEVNSVFDGVEEKYKEMFKTYEEIEVEQLWLEIENEMADEHQLEYDEIYFSEAGIEITPSEEDVIQQITESEDYYNIISVTEEYISEFKAYIDEIREMIEEGEERFNSFKQEEQRGVIIALERIVYSGILGTESSWDDDILMNSDEQLKDCWDEMMTDLENYLEDLYSKIEDSIVTEVFEPNRRLITLYGQSSKLELTSVGDIFPERGSLDEISIELFVDGVKEAVGWISKSYGDYIIEDTGAAIATNGDDLWINLDEVIIEFETYIENSIKEISDLRDAIDEELDK